MFFNFLILGKSIFPPNFFYNINHRSDTQVTESFFRKISIGRTEPNLEAQQKTAKYILKLAKVFQPELLVN